MSRKIIGPFIVAIAIVIPNTNPKVKRSDFEAIVTVETTECVYRGIEATFSELSRAYALTSFENAKFLGWEVEPDPEAPMTGMLVTGRFSTDGLSGSALRGEEAHVYIRRRQREKAVPLLQVTWRVNTLSDMIITPYNFYAEDAVGVYRDIVRGLIDKMLVTTAGAELREGPGTEYGILQTVEAGKVLLEIKKSGMWYNVKLPSTSVEGWVYEGNLRAIDEF